MVSTTIDIGLLKLDRQWTKKKNRFARERERERERKRKKKSKEKKRIRDCDALSLPNDEHTSATPTLECI